MSDDSNWNQMKAGAFGNAAVGQAVNPYVGQMAQNSTPVDLLGELQSRRETTLSRIQHHAVLLEKAKANLADLDKAISALTPEDGNDALLADQQDTPPQSNAQESETDAAEPKWPDMFWLHEDREYSVEIEEYLEDTCGSTSDGAVRFATAYHGPDVYAARIAADDFGDDWFFESFDEAEVQSKYDAEMQRRNALDEAREALRKAEAPTADERPSVVTDHDRVEQTNTDTVAAVEIPEDDEPAEIISTLTGDPAIEPESGLHGEPLPPSELDSQAQPQTKSEQSQSDPITNPDASFWTAGFEEDRKPKPGFIEGAVSKLFGVKEPA